MKQRQFPAPADGQFIRVTLAKDAAAALFARAAAGGMSASGFSRVALAMLAAGKRIGPADVIREASRQIESQEVKNKPRGMTGRPRKA